MFLILFVGKTGLRAIFSFALTILTLWKVLVPLYLKGWNPIWIGLLVTLFLTTIIISLVYGFDRRSLSAISGSFGLVTVAPFTAICAGYLLTKKNKTESNEKIKPEFDEK